MPVSDRAQGYKFGRKPLAAVVVVLLVTSWFSLHPRHAAGVATLPAGFVDEVVIEGLELPTAVAFSPDGRMFIAEKAGVVRVAVDGVLLPDPFIDLRDEVNNGFEYGLLGLAVDPAFPAQPYVYLQYVYDPPGVNTDDHAPRVQRVERVTASVDDLNVASIAPDARKVLVGKNSDINALTDPDAGPGEYRLTCWRNDAVIPDCIPSDSYRHVGGSLAFGPDRSLYITVGDVDRLPDGPQTTGSFVGSVLRVDAATGRGLVSNPFYNGDVDANISKVYTYGHRNPFRIAVHPVTGEALVGDVGAGSWEELDRLQPGGNYGWPCREGTRPNGDYADTALCRSVVSLPPVHEWPHTSSGGAAVAGDWYRGGAFPEQYREAFFFGDYSQAFIKYLKADGAGGYTVHDFAHDIGENGLVSLKNGPGGALYWLDLIGGTVHRIRYAASGDAGPFASAGASPTRGSVPFVTQFDASNSFASGSSIDRYEWDFGDGTSGSGVAPRHTYTEVGTYTARLTVHDRIGRSASTSVRIEAGNGPQLTILTPTPDSVLPIGSQVPFNATAFDPEAGDISSRIRWTGLLHHNVHVHPNLVNAVGPTGSFVLQDHEDDTLVELCAEATSNSGFTAKKCVDVAPRTAPVTLRSEPSGLSLTYQGLSRRAPYSVDANVNAERLITAPVRADRCYAFDRWSDGGARSHRISIAAARTVTAFFRYICTMVSDPEYRPNAPVRVLETRPRAGQIGYSGAKPIAGQTVELRLAQLPLSVVAVTLNLTGTEATSNGFVTVWPCGEARPNTSSLNLNEGQTAANLVVTKVGSDRRVCIFTERGTHLIADLVGHYPGATTYTAQQPQRVLETRAGAGQIGYAGAKPVAGATLQVALPMLPAGTSAAVLNITGTDASANGYVTVWPCGEPRPRASTLNLSVGHTSANLAVTKLGARNTVCLYAEQGAHLIADLVGYVSSSNYIALQPNRVLETRTAARVNYAGDKPAARQTIELRLDALPPSAIAAVLNVTGTAPTNTGYVTVWPCGEVRPNTSSLNLTVDPMTGPRTTPNAVITKLGPDRTVCIYTEAGAHLIADLVGYFDYAPPALGIPDDYVDRE